MVWSPLTDSLSLKADWQYTEPVEGTYFRLQHSGFPVNGLYEIAQAQTDASGLTELIDIQQLQVRAEALDIYLKAPPIFASRRIALRRLPKPVTLESELRRVARETILRDPEINPFPPRRIDWQVSIEVSDYVEPVISSGGGTESQNNYVDLAYVSSGDTNGVFYYLGTAKLTRAFANPATDGTIAISSNGVIAASYAASNLTDRGEPIGHTNPSASAYFRFDLGVSRKLIISHYSIQGGGDSDGQHPRNWKLQGSNDEANWTDINTQTNNSTIGLNTWFNLAITGQTTAYRYFQLLQTGNNSSGDTYLVAKEIEFYGKLFTN